MLARCELYCGNGLGFGGTTGGGVAAAVAVGAAGRISMGFCACSGLPLNWGRDWMAFDRSIDVHISNLRAKLKAHPRLGECIKTVWGTGYMFVGGK